MDQYFHDLLLGKLEGPYMADGSFTWRLHELQKHEPTGHNYCIECGQCWYCREDHR